MLEDFELAAGEALVLVDNNAFSTGIAALAVADCETLLDGLDVAGALDLEAFAANPGLIDEAVAEARPYPGLRSTLVRLRELLDGSYLWNGPARNLQDPLTFRTLPQVNGAARDALGYAKGVLAVELNAHQGNPVVAASSGRVLAAGNFDVVPLAAALDFLQDRPRAGRDERYGARPQASASAAHRPPRGARRAATSGRACVQRARRRGAGARCGGPLARAAGVVRARLDHAARGHRGPDDDGSARRAPPAEMVDLGARVAAVELTIAAQAIDLRERPALGAGTARAYALVRERVPFTAAGETVPADLEPLVELVRSGLT